ncbi:c-type cytochrome [Bradyrhizobium sp. 200]|uniref:c-type cytochrome n=1 Tax=Bradyrhizobium sp. 200 TaxID=2782665 RepID=UPI001FFEEEC4|nr:c-type cytochrome [Bradyrhizobium sp. 200]UPJ50496.1 c-type cytochrome [Bradyrhizobium sp. 200]
MSTKHCLALGATLFIAVAFGPVHAGDNPKRGAKVYGACAACHSLEPNLHLTGPSLDGLWGKKAASVANFPRYSGALKEQGFIWDEAPLNAWIADPQAFVPGTYMTFRGIDDEKVRGDLIAFLKIAMAPGGAKSAVAQGLINAEMARGQAPEPLATLGPDHQVTGIRHCQSTFFVATADGRQTPFWEMNLRLKIDSSSNGPKGGKPALVPGGMQGDRASIVFSDIEEIGRLVERKC